MSRLTGLATYAIAFILPPAIAGLIGLTALHRRDRPAILPTMDASSVAAIPRPDIDPRKPTVVVVLGSDLTEITDALGPYELFARVGRYNVVTAAAERRPTMLTGGVQILPHYSLREVTERLGGPPAIVVIPNLPNAASIENRPTINWVRQQGLSGALMHSWCKGAMALAETGLLNGQTATTHWGDIPELEKRYPAVRWARGVRWVEHGQFVMSAGITSGIDASLRVIIRVAGDSVARRIAREIRYPNYHFAIDPTVSQYHVRPADLVLLANASFRVNRPLIGVALYNGVGEIDLSNVYDAHVHTMAADVLTIAKEYGVVVTRHGLTLFPSFAASTKGAELRELRRLMVPGPEAREQSASLTAAALGAVPSLSIDYIHGAEPQRFGLAPVLEDLARTADVPTARFAQRRMEFRSNELRLTGDALPWMPLTMATALGTAGLLGALAVRRLTRRPETVRVRSADQSASPGDVAA